MINNKIEHKRRLCKVGDKHGYFHCWTHEADVIAPGIGIGSHPGGQFSTTLGIVELSDGVRKFVPEKIEFIDEEHMRLAMMDANDTYVNSLKEGTDV